MKADVVVVALLTLRKKVTCDVAFDSLWVSPPKVTL